MFQSKTTYTFADMLALSRLMSGTYRRWRTVIYRLLTGLAGAAFTLAGILMLPEEGSLLPAVFVMFVGALLILMSIFVNYVTALQSKRMVVEDLGQIEAVFDEDGFTMDCAKQTSFNPYTALHSIFRYKERYFLCLDKRHAYVLPYSSFTRGDRLEFERFLAEKTGLEWNRLNTGKAKERRLKG